MGQTTYAKARQTTNKLPSAAIIGELPSRAEAPLVEVAVGDVTLVTRGRLEPAVPVFVVVELPTDVLVVDTDEFLTSEVAFPYVSARPRANSPHPSHQQHKKALTEPVAIVLHCANPPGVQIDADVPKHCDFLSIKQSYNASDGPG